MNLRRWILGRREGPSGPRSGASPALEVLVFCERRSALGRIVADAVGHAAPVRLLHDAADLLEELEVSRRRGSDAVAILCEGERAQVAGALPVAWFARVTTLASFLVLVDRETLRVFRHGTLLLDRGLPDGSVSSIAGAVRRVARRLVRGTSGSAGLASPGTRVSSAKRVTMPAVVVEPGMAAGRVA